MKPDNEQEYSSENDVSEEKPDCKISEKELEKDKKAPKTLVGEFPEADKKNRLPYTPVLNVRLPFPTVLADFKPLDIFAQCGFGEVYKRLLEDFRLTDTTYLNELENELERLSEPTRLEERPVNQFIEHYTVYNVTYSEELPKRTPRRPQTDKTENSLTGKSKTAYLRLIKVLCMLVERYETGQPKPKYFEQRDIVTKSGRISAKALRELLQAINPDTPSRAEELIKSANKLIDDNLSVK